MQSKQTRCASIAARLHGGELFRNFANGSERKGLSAFTVKFPSSAAGLHLVLKTSYLRKKSRLAIVWSNVFMRYRSTRNICTLGVSSTVLFVFLKPFRVFAYSRKPCFSILETRSSRLETQSSNVPTIEAWGSSLQVRVSSVNLLLSGTVSQTPFSQSLWSGHHWKDLFLLQKLSINDANFWSKVKSTARRLVLL